MVVGCRVEVRLGKEHAKKMQDLTKDHKAVLSTKDAQIKAFTEQVKRYVVIKAFEDIAWTCIWALLSCMCMGMGHGRTC